MQERRLCWYWWRWCWCWYWWWWWWWRWRRCCTTNATLPASCNPPHRHRSLHNIANHLRLRSTIPPPGLSTRRPTPATTARSPMKSRATKTSKQCHRLYRRWPLKHTASQQINPQVSLFNTTTVIIYSHSCCSKPIRLWIVFETEILRYFLPLCINLKKVLRGQKWPCYKTVIKCIY